MWRRVTSITVWASKHMDIPLSPQQRYANFSISVFSLLLRRHSNQTQREKLSKGFFKKKNNSNFRHEIAPDVWFPCMLIGRGKAKACFRVILSFLIPMDTWILLSHQNIYLLKPLLPFFTARFICTIVVLLHVFILPTLHLCIRAKNRSSEISRVAKLPEKLRTDLETGLPWGSICHIRLSAGLLKITFVGRKELLWEQSGSQVKALSVQTSCLVSSQETVMVLFQVLCTFA